MRNSKKIFIFVLAVGCGFYFFWSKPEPKAPAVTPETASHAQSQVLKVQKAPSAQFLKAQDEYMKELEKNPPVVKRVYDNGQMLTDLEIAVSEEQRKQAVKMEIIRDVNEGEEPQPTAEERQLFAEMMAAQGLKSTYSAD